MVDFTIKILKYLKKHDEGITEKMLYQYLYIDNEKNAEKPVYFEWDPKTKYWNKEVSASLSALIANGFIEYKDNNPAPVISKRLILTDRGIIFFGATI